MYEFKFELGSMVEDLITGFQGVIVSRSQWIHNCNTYGCRSKKLYEGKPVDMQYFDEPQLKLLPKEKVLEKKQDTGGPCVAITPTNRF